MIPEQERKEIENAVTDLLRESIASKLSDTDVKERGFTKYDVIESYLTDIMALGYNSGSKKLAIDEIWEIQSQISFFKITKNDITNRVEKHY